MAVRAVHDDHVHMGVHQRFHALQNVAGHADARAAQKTALLILRGIRILDGLFNILDGNEPAKPAFIVHDRQLFQPGFGQDLFGFL